MRNRKWPRRGEAGGATDVCPFSLRMTQDKGSLEQDDCNFPLLTQVLDSEAEWMDGGHPYCPNSLLSHCLVAMALVMLLLCF